jgi:hypothetical protein
MLVQEIYFSWYIIQNGNDINEAYGPRHVFIGNVLLEGQGFLGAKLRLEIAYTITKNSSTLTFFTHLVGIYFYNFHPILMIMAFHPKFRWNYYANLKSVPQIKNN